MDAQTRKQLAKPLTIIALIALTIVVAVAIVGQDSLNGGKRATMERAYAACKDADEGSDVPLKSGIRMSEDSNHINITGGATPATVTCLANQLGIDDTFTTTSGGAIRQWGDYSMRVFDPDPYHQGSEHTMYELTLQLKLD